MRRGGSDRRNGRSDGVPSAGRGRRERNGSISSTTVCFSLFVRCNIEIILFSKEDKEEGIIEMLGELDLSQR